MLIARKILLFDSALRGVDSLYVMGKEKMARAFSYMPSVHLVVILQMYITENEIDV